MDTYKLQQYCTVFETGSLTKAANILRVSHSGISKNLRLLEEWANRQLLLAEGRGITFTDDGKIFYKEAKHIVLKMERLQRGVEPDPEARIRIATFEVFSTYFISDLIESELAGMHLSMKERTPGLIEQSLITNEVDIGITYIPVASPGIDFLPITKFRMGLFGRNDVFDKALAVRDLPFAAPSIPVSGSTNEVTGLDGWPELEFPRNIIFDVDLMESGLELCRRGRAVMFLPEFVVSLHNKRVPPHLKLAQLSFPSKFKVPSFQVFLLKRTSSPENRVMKRIAKGLRRVCSTTNQNF